MKNNNITILVDNDSWILPYANKLKQEISKLGHKTALIYNHQDIDIGWINFILGYTKIIPSDILKKSAHNLVVHESDLPKGRGFAPMTWQILEGKNEIPICLMEAAPDVDSGGVWIKDKIILDGTELCDEWRDLQGRKTIQICIKFISEYDRLQCIPQSGIPTWYERRSPKNSKLDPKKTIEDQFNMLRVVDNARYPAYFDIFGCRYTIKIEKTDGKPSK